jgi:hypothetical protein
MKIYTSRYSNKALAQFATDGNSIMGITVGYPQFKLPYQFTYYRAWGPDRAWKNAPYEEYLALYMQKLDMIGIDSIMAALSKQSEIHGGGDICLVCFEDIRKPGEWCHRCMFAQYLKDHAGVEVEELLDPTPVKGGPKLAQQVLFEDTSVLPQQTLFC